MAGRTFPRGTAGSLQCHAGRDASGPQWRRCIAHRLPEGPVADGSRIAVLAEYPGSSAQGRRRKQCIAVFLSFALQTLLSTQPVEECRFGCRETSMEVSGVRGSRKKTVVQVNNPTPYYVSFASVELIVDGRVMSVGKGMVAPFSTKEFDWQEIRRTWKPLPSDTKSSTITVAAIPSIGHSANNPSVSPLSTYGPTYEWRF